MNKVANEVMAERLSGLSCVVFHLKEKGTPDVLGTFEVLISKNISVSLQNVRNILVFDYIKCFLFF